GRKSIVARDVGRAGRGAAGGLGGGTSFGPELGGIQLFKADARGSMPRLSADVQSSAWMAAPNTSLSSTRSPERGSCSGLAASLAAEAKLMDEPLSGAVTPRNQSWLAFPAEPGAFAAGGGSADFSVLALSPLI